MKNEWLVKIFAFGIVVLFIDVSFQPIIAEKIVLDEKEFEYNNVDFEEAKEYLFQTLIDISNNPEVKQFLNEPKNSLISRNNNNYDCKNTIQKIYSHNPKLLKSIFFTRPKMTYDYLEKNYKKGLKIVEILGLEETSNMMESVKISNKEFFSELKNIIANDEELSNRVSVLEEMNNNLISNLDFKDHPIICALLMLTCVPIFILLLFFSILMAIFEKNPNLIQKHPVLFKWTETYLFLTSVLIAYFYSAAMYYCYY